MADYELRYRRGPGLVSRVFGAIGVGALVGSLEDQELDAPDPRVVTWTERSSALRRRAFELVGAGRYDRAAADELATAAGRHTHELRRAAASVRQGGWAREDEMSFRADQLLVAAAAGRAPTPLDEERLAWFRQVRALVAGPVDEGFAELSAVEPGLTLVEADVLRIAAAPGFDGWDEARRLDALAPVLSGRLGDLCRRSASPLLRTQAAWFVIRDHAHGIAGVVAPDSYRPPGADLSA